MSYIHLHNHSHFSLLDGLSQIDEMVSTAKNYGMNPERMFHFDNAAESAKFVQDRIQTGDLILVKGSRDMHCENIVREIMAEPWKADELLV